MTDYVHGYAPRESKRLTDQANTLSDLLHSDSVFPPGSHILEAGCGVGAQTVHLSARNPTCTFLSIDTSAASITLAKQLAADLRITNVTFEHRDLFELSLQDQFFDHIFICFVLEHLPRPVAAIRHLRQLLKPQGTITVIEGDHGSFYCHPESEDARRTVECLINLQTQSGGNSLIGRQLYPLLTAAGLPHCVVTPRHVYVDHTHPQLVDGFVRQTFIAMVEGVKHNALAQGMIDGQTWQRGIDALYRAAQPDGVFCYTFFKAVASQCRPDHPHI